MISFKNRFNNIDFFQFSIGTNIIIIYWYHLERRGLLLFRKTITGLFLSTSSSSVASGLIMETAASAAGESSTSWVSSSLFRHCGQMTKKMFQLNFSTNPSKRQPEKTADVGNGRGTSSGDAKKSAVFSGERWGRFSTKFYTGRLHPEVQPLAL